MANEHTIHPFLRAIRKQQGKTLEQVEAATGIDNGHLSRIERGLHRITPDIAQKLVEFYGKDHVTELMLLYPERYTVAQKDAA